MTMGQEEHGPFGRAETGHDKGTGQMNKSLLMLCIISLAISTPSASARPRRDEWRLSLRYKMTVNETKMRLPEILSWRVELLCKAIRPEKGLDPKNPPYTVSGTMGAPRQEVIALSLILGLFLSSG